MIATRSAIVVSFTVAVAVLLWLVSPPKPGAAAPAPQPAAAAEADFKGKVLTISTTYPDKAGAILEEVQVRKVGGRSFLVGKGVDDGRPVMAIYKGQTIWISVDHIVQIVEFASVEDLKKKMRDATPPVAPAVPGSPLQR